MITTQEGSFNEGFDIKKLNPSWSYMICLTIYCGLSSQMLAAALCSTGAAWSALSFQIDAP